MLAKKVSRRNKIRKRIRKSIIGSATKPRLSVFRSNKEIYAQIIDDEAGVTLLATSSNDKAMEGKSGSKSELSKMVGATIAEMCKSKGIESVVFDRGGYLYHGRVKSLAEGAREAGLKF